MPVHWGHRFECCECDDTREDVEWVGDIAVMLNIIAMLPQLYHVYAHQNAKSLSYLWLTVSMTANFLWLYFGVSKEIYPLIYSAVFFIFAFTSLGVMKWVYDK
jgi:MtN3 and saliva related transmembrane protein